MLQIPKNKIIQAKRPGWHVTIAKKLRDGRTVVSGKILHFQRYIESEKEYTKPEYPPEICVSGMHACDTITDALGFIPYLKHIAPSLKGTLFLHKVVVHDIIAKRGYTFGSIAFVQHLFPPKFVGASRKSLWAVSVTDLEWNLTGHDKITEKQLVQTAELLHKEHPSDD